MSWDVQIVRRGARNAPDGGLPALVSQAEVDDRIAAIWPVVEWSDDGPGRRGTVQADGYSIEIQYGFVSPAQVAMIQQLRASNAPMTREAFLQLSALAAKSGPVSDIMLHLRGGGNPLEKIASLCSMNDWEAWDSGDDELIDLANPSSKNWQAFQGLRDSISDPPDEDDDG